jgi:hypothetical protein
MGIEREQKATTGPTKGYNLGQESTVAVEQNRRLRLILQMVTPTLAPPGDNKTAASTAKAEKRPADTALGIVGFRRKRRKSSEIRKKPKDMPSRALSAYNYFFREERPKVLVERANVSAETLMLESTMGNQSNFFSSMGKMVAKRWKQLSTKKRERFTEMAAQDMKRYRGEIEIYREKIKEKERSDSEKITSNPPTKLEQQPKESMPPSAVSQGVDMTSLAGQNPQVQPSQPSATSGPILPNANLTGESSSSFQAILIAQITQIQQQRQQQQQLAYSGQVAQWEEQQLENQVILDGQLPQQYGTLTNQQLPQQNNGQLFEGAGQLQFFQEPQQGRALTVAPGQLQDMSNHSSNTGPQFQTTTASIEFPSNAAWLPQEWQALLLAQQQQQASPWLDPTLSSTTLMPNPLHPQFDNNFQMAEQVSRNQQQLSDPNDVRNCVGFGAM